MLARHDFSGGNDLIAKEANTTAPSRERRDRSMRAGALLLLWIGLIACDAGEVADRAEPAAQSSRATGPIDTVILVSIDSLRADHLGAYGHPEPTSPTIDRLAKQGLRFDRAYSTTSWTLPSHAALFSGLDDLSHGANHALAPLPSRVVTLAEALGEHGVRSTGFFAGPFLHPTYGLGQGFDDYIDSTSYGWKAKGDNLARAPHDASHADVTNPILIDRVRAWLSGLALDERDSDSPERRFVFIHMWDVHYDYIAPESYVEIFDPDYRGTLQGTDFLDNPAIHPGMPRRDYEHLLALYDAEIRFTDDTLGALLDAFDAAGLLDRSAVIVTADHGEEFLEHGQRGHALTLFEEVLRVPMVLWIPGATPIRSVSDEVVSLIDIFPLVCDLFDVDCAYAGPGRSLLSQYEDEAPTPLRGNALAEVKNDFLGRHLSAVVDRNGKLIRDDETGKHDYYPDGQADADASRVAVRRNALWRHPESIRKSVGLLERRVAESLALGETLGATDEQEDEQIDADTRQQLEALGYIGDDAADAEEQTGH
jgi:arylsulfatase A-like enzyme